MNTITSIRCQCGNDSWEKVGDTLFCVNCGFDRPYHRRTGHGEGISRSQQRKIDAIKLYFERWNRDKTLHEFTVTDTDYGVAWVSVYTTDNVYTNVGGHFAVTRRGAMTVHSVYDLCSSDDARNERKRYYADSLGGKVAK